MAVGNGGCCEWCNAPLSGKIIDPRPPIRLPMVPVKGPPIVGYVLHGIFYIGLVGLVVTAVVYAIMHYNPSSAGYHYHSYRSGRGIAGGIYAMGAMFLGGLEYIRRAWIMAHWDQCPKCRAKLRLLDEHDYPGGHEAFLYGCMRCGQQVVKRC